MRLLVNVGGAELEAPQARLGLARAVGAARGAGHQVILVHGGGDQIRALGARLGIAERYHQGLRVTDADTAQAVLMVLGGQVNRQLVATLEDQGVPAVGLTGADGRTFDAARHAPDGVDLGYVGRVSGVRPALAEHLLAAGYVPVVASVAPLGAGDAGPRDRFYNINADHAAGPLARAFAADALLFLSDVPGVLDAAGERITTLGPERAAALGARRVIAGGMIPKVEAAVAALADNPKIPIKIAPAGGESAILDALADDVGTRICPDL